MGSAINQIDAQKLDLPYGAAQSQAEFELNKKHRNRGCDQHKQPTQGTIGIERFFFLVYQKIAYKS